MSVYQNRIVTDGSIREQVWAMLTNKDGGFYTGEPTDSEAYDGFTGREGPISTYEVVELDPKCVVDSTWFKEYVDDNSVPSLPKYAVCGGGAGNDGWDILLTEDLHLWGTDIIEYGASGPAYNGHYSTESRVDMVEWIHRLLEDVSELDSLWF
jgi:hypothetical protein